MVTVEEIVKELELELEQVEALDEETACKEEVERVYETFRAEKEKKVGELRAAIESITKINSKLVALELEAETENESNDVGV